VSTPDEVLDAIDQALDDYAVSEDAMRWTPEPPEQESVPGGEPYRRHFNRSTQSVWYGIVGADGAVAEWRRIEGWVVTDEGLLRGSSPEAAAIPDVPGDAIISWVDRHARDGFILESWQQDFVRRMLRDHGPDVLFVEVRRRWPLPSRVRAEYRRRRAARQRRRR
jgi:hypothetical protein